MSSKIHSFWTGVGSVLNLLPETRGEGRFLYKGRDIASLTAEEALRQDWEIVGNGISGAVKTTVHAKKIAGAQRKRSRQRRIVHQ